jgi:tRNA threonylcarbamoyladenosine biosynthesis protein TsaE
VTQRFHTRGPAETEELGGRLATTLSAGDVVLVEGELGAGKTTFVRGACRALGVTGPVTSPTFTIGQRYRAPVPIAHLDLYRVGELSTEDPELLADYLGPDRGEEEVAGMARIAARVRIAHAGGDERILEIG